MAKEKLANDQVRGVFDAKQFTDTFRHNDLPREAHIVMPGGPSLTRQEMAAECDINNIMKQYEKHLADPMRSVREPRYYDFTQMPDTLMGAMDVFHRAEEAFMTLPAQVRREFDNDPALFADFASDPENLEQMREWELAPRPEPPAKAPPTEVVIVQGDLPKSPEPPKGG